MDLVLGHADLNIPVENSTEAGLKALVKRALELGYQTVALNTVVDQENLMTKRKKMKAGELSKISEFPEPSKVELVTDDYPDLNSRGLKPKLLTRLTIVISDNDFLIHYNKSEVVKKYDLLAIIPKSAQCLISLLKSSFRFDILSYTPDLIYTGVKWQRKLYNECVEKFIHFELLYVPTIVDREDRRKTIGLSHSYQSIGKSKKIFLSSFARKPIELRAPGDVANLAFIFGLNENQGKDAVKKHCSDVYKAALGRKLGVYRVRVEKVQGPDTEHDCSSESDEMDTD